MTDKEDGIAKRQKNLIPLKKGTSRAKEIASMGGKASQVKIKKTKNLKESLQALLLTELTPKQKAAYKKMGFNIDMETVATHLDLAGARCLAKVISTGDQKAMKDLAEMAGMHLDEKKIIVDGNSDQLRPIIHLSLGTKPDGL